MNNDWLDRLNAPADSRATRDAMERATQYQGVAGPRWNGIKIDLKASVESYNRKPETRTHVEIEDAGHRLVLRGRDHALDITFYQNKSRIIGAYRSHKQRRRQFIALRLDMRDDGLLVIDRRGCLVDDQAHGCCWNRSFNHSVKLNAQTIGNFRVVGFLAKCLKKAKSPFRRLTQASNAQFRGGSRGG